MNPELWRQNTRMVQRQKLLFMAPLCPLPVASGTQARVLGLVQRLSRSFDITLLMLIPAPDVAVSLDPLETLCMRIVAVVPDNKRSALHRGAYKALYWLLRLGGAESADRFYATLPRARRAIRREIREQSYDVLFLSYWFWAPWVAAAPGLKVIDTNDVQWERYAADLRRSRNPIETVLAARLLRAYRRREARALASADIVIATTSRDRDVFATQAGLDTEIVVVPTGVDVDTFKVSARAPDPGHIAFYGALHNPTNADAAKYLIADIFPRIQRRVPGVKLTLVGSSPSPQLRALVASDPDITLTGTVDDVRERLQRAGVVVLPLRIVHGIRGRIFELLAMGIPIVATTAAVRGMDLEPGAGVLLADDPEAFAAAVARVLEDPALRDELGRRGRQLVESSMTFESTYDRLATFLAQRARNRRV